jgi:hypothetical protein
MRGCLWRLVRLLVLGAILFGLLVIFLPQILARAGNTLLNNINSSAAPISGLAQFIPANFLDKNNKLQISLSGLDANKKYDVTLDPGTCGNYGYVDVGLITSDGNGNVTTTFSLSPLNKSSGGWFVDVHSGASASDSVIACSQLNTNDASAAADVSNTTLQLSPVPSDLTSAQVTPGLTTTNTTPKGFPQTGVAPGGSNSYDNNAYPRKF